jgi:YD repeat-containing protein
MFPHNVREYNAELPARRTTAMKRLLSCLTFLLMGFASSNLCAQQNPLYFNKENLRKNKIRSIAEAQYYPCEIEQKNVTDTESSFDSRGNMTRRYRYGKWTGDPQLEINKYDDKDNVVEGTTSDYRTYHIEHKYTLDDKGRVVEDTHSDGRHTYKYNAAGNLVESAEFRPDGSLESKETLNDKGDLTEAIHYNSSKTVYTYDGAGHRTKEEDYDSHGHLSARTVSTYDEAGHNAKDEKYDSGGQLSFVTVYTHDQAGHNTKKEDYGPDGKTLTGWSTFKFDPKGLVIEEDVFGSKGECKYLTKTMYTFYP